MWYKLRVTQKKKVAALFVDGEGAYSTLDFVDLWPIERDARLYAGPLPVVAHPPCNLWVNLAALNFKRYGGEHNRPGNDGGAFAAAVRSVQQWGGVLEHPAGSHAWAAHGLTPPSGVGWQRSLFGGWVCEVWQSVYGHKARKRTWLFYCGAKAPFGLRWERKAGSAQIGWFDRVKPTLGKREASATPPAFRDELVKLAYTANQASDCSLVAASR